MRRTPTEPYSHFAPREYLAEYYVGLSVENDFVLRFYDETYGALDDELRLLEVGGGPTIYQLISASRRASEIVFADYLDANLDEVRAWQQGDASAFDWSEYLERVAEIEGDGSCAAATLAERVRSRITQLVHCDLTGDPPLRPETPGDFDVVSSAFCLEGITQDRRMFSVFLRRVASLMREGGTLVATVVRESEAYKVGDCYFPACPLDEGSLTRALEGAGYGSVRIASLRTDDDHGYTGIMAVTARRQAQGEGQPA